MEPTRRLFLAAVAGLPFAAAARAADAAPPINTLAGARVAIHGYDPVAYFVEGGPRQGRADFSAEHRGAVWRFSSVENRQRFLADPERYVPAFGGYCAYGVAQGYLVKIDPQAWAIVDGRLYLNYDTGVRTTWLKDVPGYNAAARANWQKLVAQP